MLMCKSYLVDFVNFFRSGDQKFHQESEMDCSRIDMLDGQITQETAESTFGGDKNYSDNMLTSTSMTCNGNIEVDTRYLT